MILMTQGYRVIAMSILPINESTLCYGSMDAGRTVQKSEKVLIVALKKAAKILNLKKHLVGFTEDSCKVLHAAGDVEGSILIISILTIKVISGPMVDSMSWTSVELSPLNVLPLIPNDVSLDRFIFKCFDLNSYVYGLIQSVPMPSLTSKDSILKLIQIIRSYSERPDSSRQPSLNNSRPD